MNRIDFTNSRVLVVGDTMLDLYHFGTVSRISPEAPVPVIKVTKEKRTLGGAGNVVNNVAHLNAQCELISVAGKDANRKLIEDMMSALNVTPVLIDNGLPTTAKLRVIGERQQICRLDFEEIQEISGDAREQLLAELKERLPKAGIVVISDYGKGVCTEVVCDNLIAQARHLNIPVIVDPKGADWTKYMGATIVTPNVKELAEVAGKDIANTDEDIEFYGKKVLDRYNLTYLIVTRSDKGMSIITREFCKHIPTEAREVFDVSGAGDTVVATLACALASGYDVLEAMTLANHAAGVVVSKVGTAPIEYRELLESFDEQDAGKLLPRDAMAQTVQRLKDRGKKVVFTNGCFDILHKGHVTYLKAAKEQGDILVLGLNSDASVRRLKGATRPINNELDRAEVLGALECIDYITIFDEDTPWELLSVLRPDILVKGGDYSVETVIGREFAAETRILNFVDGYSTTKIIEAAQRGE